MELLRIEEQKITWSVRDSKSESRENQVAASEFAHRHDHAHDAVEVAAIAMIPTP